MNKSSAAAGTADRRLSDKQRAIVDAIENALDRATVPIGHLVGREGANADDFCIAVHALSSDASRMALTALISRGHDRGIIMADDRDEHGTVATAETSKPIARSRKRSAKER